MNLNKTHKKPMKKHIITLLFYIILEFFKISFVWLMWQNTSLGKDNKSKCILTLSSLWPSSVFSSYGIYYITWYWKYIKYIIYIWLSNIKKYSQSVLILVSCTTSPFPYNIHTFSGFRLLTLVFSVLVRI